MLARLGLASGRDWDSNSGPNRDGDGFPYQPPVAARKADFRAARLLTPNIGEEAQPILAHNLANLGLWPTFVFHRSGQIGKIAECAHPRRVHDVAQRTRHAPPISLVMANIFEEGIILALGEVGPDPDMVLARNADHVVDRRDVILDGRVISSSEEGRKHGYPDKPTVFDNEADFLIRFVARMSFQSCRQNMRVGGRPFRRDNDVARSHRVDMAEIAQNTDAVHLGHHLVPKAAEPGIAAFVTAGTRQVLAAFSLVADLILGNAGIARSACR
jgi:hypothetical protein